jgi:hypothetical protein
LRRCAGPCHPQQTSGGPSGMRAPCWAWLMNHAVSQVYQLLTMNYVEDDDNMFRCAPGRGCTVHAGLPPSAFGQSPARLLQGSREISSVCLARRFKYSQEFLQWALQPPGYQLDWVLGVRVAGALISCRIRRLLLCSSCLINAPTHGLMIPVARSVYSTSLAPTRCLLPC